MSKLSRCISVPARDIVRTFVSMLSSFILFGLATLGSELSTFVDEMLAAVWASSIRPSPVLDLVRGVPTLSAVSKSQLLSNFFVRDGILSSLLPTGASEKPMLVSSIVSVLSSAPTTPAEKLLFLLFSKEKLISLLFSKEKLFSKDVFEDMLKLAAWSGRIPIDLLRESTF